ncbi:hypothetical protein [Vibrio phage RYC]|nr:hypothetical protein [Vibrio phage RYC]
MKSLLKIGTIVLSGIVMMGCEPVKTKTKLEYNIESTVYTEAAPKLTEVEKKLLIPIMVEWKEFYGNTKGIHYEGIMKISLLRKEYSYTTPFCDIVPQLEKRFLESSDWRDSYLKDSVIEQWKRFTGESLRESCIKEGFHYKDSPLGIVIQEEVVEKLVPIIEEDVVEVVEDTIQNLPAEEIRELAAAAKKCNIAKVQMITMLSEEQFTQESKDKIERLISKCEYNKLIEDLNK